MRTWHITTHDNGNLVISLVSTNPPHVVNYVAEPTLPAAELSRLLTHLEEAADEHAQAAAVPDIRVRGTIKGSLSVHAADGTDITQPPEQPAANA